MTSKVKYGPCNNQLFSAAIDILTEYTGKKWGFVHNRKVTRAVCEELGISAGKGKNVTIKITTKALGTKWKDTLKIELCIALTEYSKRTGAIFPSALHDCKTRDGAKIADLIGPDVDLSKCTAVNTYRDTFIHAPTDWILRETVFEGEKPLTLGDYM